MAPKVRLLERHTGQLVQQKVPRTERQTLYREVVGWVAARGEPEPICQVLNPRLLYEAEAS